MSLFGDILSYVGRTVKETAYNTMVAVADEKAKSDYMNEELDSLQSIIDDLKHRLIHKGFEGDEYTDYEIMHIYAALYAAKEKRFCYVDDTFFEELTRDGYNVENFIN